MDVDDFVNEHKPREGGNTFQLENSKLLDAAVDGSILAKVGAMVAYTGDVSFVGQSSAEGGITGWL
jgi:hypothetical protein